MLRDELDILECRLTELQDEDVTHVLVEATVNHRGHPKPLAYADNRSRFAPWEDRIVHVAVTDLEGGGPWEREQAQRELARRGLVDAGPDDVIINSDADEILTPNAIRLARDLDGGGYRLLLRHFIFACDWEITGGETWDKPVMARYRDITGFTRFRRSNTYPQAPGEYGPMGWHLSFFGGPEQVRVKMDGCCHDDMLSPFAAYLDEGRCWERGEFPFHPYQATPVEPDGTWPRYVREGRAPASWFRPRQNTSSPT